MFVYYNPYFSTITPWGICMPLSTMELVKFGFKYLFLLDCCVWIAIKSIRLTSTKEELILKIYHFQLTNFELLSAFFQEHLYLWLHLQGRLLMITVYFEELSHYHIQTRTERINTRDPNKFPMWCTQVSLSPLQNP